MCHLMVLVNHCRGCAVILCYCRVLGSPCPRKREILTVTGAMKLCFASNTIIVGANEDREQKVWRKIYQQLSAAYRGGLSSRMMRLIERPTRFPVTLHN